jgi:hypothetical protein
MDPSRKPRLEREGFAFHCLRCGHWWNSRDGKRPVACACCCSAYWDKPKRSCSKRTPLEGTIPMPKFQGILRKEN